MQYSVVVIVPERNGKDYSSSHIMIDVAQDPFMATVYRTALVVALVEFFGRVQIFGDELAFAKCCQKEWPDERINQVVAGIIRKRGLN
jgi:hypothetical protein